jgi:flagellar protein FliO/FliZ
VVELVVRLVFSLAVVVGMLLLLTKLSAKRFRGSAESLVRVVHRQPLSRSSSVAVVTVGSRVLVLGTTEQQVQLLTELDPEELDLSSAEGLDLELDSDLESSSYAEVDAVVREIGPAPRRTAPSAGPDRATRPPTRLGRPGGKHAAAVADTPLAGSVLSPQTWKQAFAAATGRERDAS